MGYTHYFTQTKDFTKKEWADVSEAVKEICYHVQHKQDIALGNAFGDAGTQPEFTDDLISFNGLGEDAHETFIFRRKRLPAERGRRGWDFCKTAYKPYDLAVTAALCYLSTCLEAKNFSTGSDGDGKDWLAGLELARQALPHLANQLDIPIDILREDRWCPPWPHLFTKSVDFRFCVDGHAYVFKLGKEHEAYRFESHFEAAEWANSFHALFNSTGFFDKRRRQRLSRLQARILNGLLKRADLHGCRHAPPAFVRPSFMGTVVEEVRPYSFKQILEAAQ